MKRGEIWWAALPAPAGRRPVLLLSRDAAYSIRSAATVAPLTRTIRHIPVEVPLDRRDGVSARCVVNLDDLATIPLKMLTDRITSLSPQRMEQVEQAIRFALDLGPRP